MIVRAEVAVAPASAVRSPREAVVAAWTKGPIAKMPVSRCRAKRILNTCPG